jgi:hypothetical protein
MPRILSLIRNRIKAQNDDPSTGKSSRGNVTNSKTSSSSSRRRRPTHHNHNSLNRIGSSSRNIFRRIQSSGNLLKSKKETSATIPNSETALVLSQQPPQQQQPQYHIIEHAATFSLSEDEASAVSSLFSPVHNDMIPVGPKLAPVLLQDPIGIIPNATLTQPPSLEEEDKGEPSNKGGEGIKHDEEEKAVSVVQVEEVVVAPQNESEMIHHLQNQVQDLQRLHSMEMKWKDIELQKMQLAMVQLQEELSRTKDELGQVTRVKCELWNVITMQLITTAKKSPSSAAKSQIEERDGGLSASSWVEWN